MMHRLWAILMFVATLASGQDAHPTIRVEVKSGEAAIQDAVQRHPPGSLHASLEA
jgi:hypothetical protein